MTIEDRENKFQVIIMQIKTKKGSKDSFKTDSEQVLRILEITQPLHLYRSSQSRGQLPPQAFYAPSKCGEAQQQLVLLSLG